MMNTSVGCWFLLQMTAGILMLAIGIVNSNRQPPTTTRKPTSTTKITTTIRPQKCPYFLESPYFVKCFYGNGQCYCFIKANLDWTGAKEFCRTGNMTLLSIEEYGEDHLIFGYGKYNPGLYYSDYWTSGKFSGKGKRRWEWATTRPCQPMKYTNWNTEEPSNSESASCVSLRFFYTDFYQWHWNNKPCNNLAGVICESIPAKH